MSQKIKKKKGILKNPNAEAQNLGCQTCTGFEREIKPTDADRLVVECQKHERPIKKKKKDWMLSDHSLLRYKYVSSYFQHQASRHWLTSSHKCHCKWARESSLSLRFQRLGYKKESPPVPGCRFDTVTVGIIVENALQGKHAVMRTQWADTETGRLRLESALQFFWCFQSRLGKPVRLSGSWSKVPLQVQVSTDLAKRGSTCVRTATHFTK